jgi:hypothetical protein
MEKHTSGAKREWAIKPDIFSIVYGLTKSRALIQTPVLMQTLKSH